MCCNSPRMGALLVETVQPLRKMLSPLQLIPDSTEFHPALEEVWTFERRSCRTGLDVSEEISASSRWDSESAWNQARVGIRLLLSIFCTGPSWSLPELEVCRIAGLAADDR